MSGFLYSQGAGPVEMLLTEAESLKAAKACNCQRCQLVVRNTPPERIQSLHRFLKLAQSKPEVIFQGIVKNWTVEQFVMVVEVCDLREYHREPERTCTTAD